MIPLTTARMEMVIRLMTDLTKGGYSKLRSKKIIMKEKLPPSW
jgi:hypothetical protein